MLSNSLPGIPLKATYLSQLKRLSDENPDKEAFVFIDKDGDKTVLTRKNVWDKSRKYAAILRRHGIQRGDIVCNTLVNSPERLLSALGTVVAGAISMHGQVFQADGQDIINSLQIAKCKAIIIDPGHSKGAMSILERLQHSDEITGQVRYKNLPHLKSVIRVRVCCNEDEGESYRRGFTSLEEEKDMYEEPSPNENDVAFIFATSGTTGFPKLVPHNHRVCFYIGRLLGLWTGLQSDQSRYFVDKSLGWLGGFPGLYPVFGATRILTDHSLGFPEKADKHLLRILVEERIDCGLFLPTDFEAIANLEKSGKKQLKPLRVVLCGGMPIAERLLKDYRATTDGVNVLYGTTELGPLACLHVEEGVVFEDFCCGRPNEDLAMIIVDKDLNEVPMECIGQVAVRHSIITPAYLHDQESTNRSFTKDGFFLTGDHAYMDEKGLLHVLGRDVDVIQKGMCTHYPGWLESKIQKCPGVEKVAVIGVPDQAHHQEICACIIQTPGQRLTIDQLQHFLTDAKLQISAIPKYYLFFDTFPFNHNGKLDRKALKIDSCSRLEIN